MGSSRSTHLSHGFPVLSALVVLTTFLSGGQVRGHEEVKVKWGVADTTASVGRPFRLHIPSDAFTAIPQSYKIRVSDAETLPSWLEFEESEKVLQGIPTPNDVGQIEVEVLVQGPINEAATSFSLLVRDVQHHTAPSPLKYKKSGPEIVRCKREEPETLATIVLDSDMEVQSPKERMAVLKKFMDHMDLMEDMVKMVPVGNSALHDSSALVSGSGDSQSPQTKGTFISWPVGCGQVKEGHFPILQRLDEDSTSGKMAKVMNIPVIGWHVTNSHIHAPKRKRRQALATATAVMTPVAPTKTETKDSMTDDGMDKLTRTVVDMETPTIKPTSTQPEMMQTSVTPMPPKESEVKIKPTMVDPPKSETKPTPPIKPTMTETGTSTEVPPVVKCPPGQKPIASNKFSKLMYTAGQIIDFQIPKDAFVDCEVGDTPGLTLSLFNDQMEPLPKGSFFQLDAENQKIIGLPLDGDKGRKRLTLVGKKMSDGKTLLDKFNFLLVIKPSKKQKINHELSVTIDFPFDQFKSSVENQTNLANKIGRLYGDSDASNLVVTKMKAGSVEYGWANKSAMSAKDCPVGDIQNMAGKLLNKDGSLTQEAIDIMDPFFLAQAGAQPTPGKSCAGKFEPIKSKRRVKPTTAPKVTDALDTTPKPKESTDKPMDKSTNAPVVPPMADKNSTMAPTEAKTDKPTEPEVKATEPPKEGGDTDKVAKGSTEDDDDDDVLITTVVPAIVIVAILIIALIIACCLYRKKRKGKMNVEEQNTFANKGVPIIFQDELEDKPSDVNKPLLVEGGSPAPPPEYHRGPSESPELANNHRNPTAPTEDGIQEFPERPYEPPAPPVTGSGANKQPRPTQQPLSQPPQILP